MSITVAGKFGYKATVLKDSISPQGIRFITFEVEYWRGILAELNTHRMLSKNSASSRAIPFKKMVEQLTARPARFGQANPGMQDKGEDYHELVELPEYLKPAYCEFLMHLLAPTPCPIKPDDLPSPVWCGPDVAWAFHKFISVGVAGAFNDAGYHKQVYNRTTETHQMMKTVLSGTEWNNVFWLRDHDAADPSFQELARVLRLAKDESKPMVLLPGEWHLPYVETAYDYADTISYYIEDDTCDGGRRMLTLDDAIKVSEARCAAVSFRNVDYGVEKSREVAVKLVGEARKHASAFEHQATPMVAPRVLGLGDDGTGLINAPFDPFTWEPGVSHVDRQGQLWSGNLRGWVQNRKLIEGENVPG